MARKNYQVDEVLKSLSKKKDVRIDNKTIFVIIGYNAQNDLGNGSQGKIDYLVNYCGYIKIFVRKW